MAAKSDDVARIAGVSRPAVSQILNGRGRFSAETIDRVRTVAAELGYRPSAAARSLATGTSDVVVALIPDTTFGKNLQDAFDALTTELARVGLTLVLRLSSSPIELLDHFIATTRPAAVVASFGPVSPEVRVVLRDAGVPLVGGDDQALEQFNVNIGHLQADHLIAAGCRQLVYAHLSDTRQDVFGDARERGVAERCAGAGLDAPQTIRLGVAETEAIAALRQIRPGQVGIACYNDDVAIALLDACRVLRRPVPSEVALIGMDATPIAGLVWPRITTIALDAPAAMAEIAQVVIDRMNRGTTREVPLGTRLRLIPGATT